MNDEKYDNYLNSLMYHKVWSNLIDKQHSIDQQMEEAEKKYNQKQNEKKHLIDEAGNDFSRRMAEKQRQMNESSERFLQQIRANSIEPQTDKEITSEEEITPNIKRSKKKRRVSSSIDIVANPSIRDIDSRLARLESLILEAGFTIIESSENTIKIDIMPNR